MAATVKPTAHHESMAWLIMAECIFHVVCVCLYVYGVYTQDCRSDQYIEEDEEEEICLFNIVCRYTNSAM